MTQHIGATRTIYQVRSHMQKFAKHVAEGLVRAILPLPIRSRRAALPCPCSAPGMALRTNKWLTLQPCNWRRRSRA